MPSNGDPDNRRIWNRQGTKLPNGQLRYGKRNISISFPPTLFAQILTEAKTSGKSFAEVVRTLCEASINGIE